jgi:hypothetical protein
MTADPKAYQGRPDGEYFVDEAPKPIPAKDTWETLSINQLIDVSNQLQEKLYVFRRQPALAKHLETALTEVQALISVRGQGL